MGIASFVIGILSLSGVCVGLVPLLNFLNCLTLPVAVVGGALGFVDLLRDKRPGDSRLWAVLGLTLNSLALVVGGVRFLISILTTGGIL